MECPVCVGTGQTSEVQEPPRVTRTTAHSEPYLDDHRAVHEHDPNKTTSEYECSKGHRWWMSAYASCWCGWQKDRAPEVTVQPPESN